MSHALTLITFIPIVGMVLVLALPATMKDAYKWIAVCATIPQLLIALFLFQRFDTTTTAIQFAEKAPWMPTYHISYFMGVDGISISMVLLTAIICFFSVFASFGINRAEKGYYAMLLMLDTGMMGVFVSMDFFLFYIFWEVMLLPMYFLIGIWGGPRREYAAIKFFLYTLLGSVLILLAMLGLYYYSATPTFDLTELAANSSHYSIGFQRVAWIALFIGFAIKIPAFPFHTWLPDAHVEAPTAISVILAGVLLKMGTYGILRVNFAVLPAATMQLAWLFLGVIGTVNIVYGAMCAMAQTDYKKLIAYSSISHMGYVMLGLASFTAAGINGAVLQMFRNRQNKGVVTDIIPPPVKQVDSFHRRAGGAFIQLRREGEVLSTPRGPPAGGRWRPARTATPAAGSRWRCQSPRRRSRPGSPVRAGPRWSVPHPWPASRPARPVSCPSRERPVLPWRFPGIAGNPPEGGSGCW